jgi:hypothetical protein
MSGAEERAVLVSWVREMHLMLAARAGLPLPAFLVLQIQIAEERLTEAELAEARREVEAVLAFDGAGRPLPLAPLPPVVERPPVRRELFPEMIAEN